MDSCEPAAMPPRRERILFVSEDGLYPGFTGGLEIQGRAFVDHLSRSRDVSVLTRKDWMLADGTSQHVSLHGTEFHMEWIREHVSWTLGTLLAAVVIRRSLRALKAGFRPDVVYFNKAGTLPRFVVRELVKIGGRAVARFGDRHSLVLGAVLAENTGGSPSGVERPMTAVFNCEFLRRFYAPVFKGRARLHVIYDGVDLQRFHPASVPVAAPCFVFLGRTTLAKGYLEFCRAMGALPPSLVSRVDVIGTGPDLDHGLTILRESGMGDRLGYVGSEAHASVPDRLRFASILVLPSNDEGLPAAVLEAMASGLAVLASDVGGIPEVVRHGETGLMFPSDDLGGLIRACRAAAESDTLRRRLGANARDLVARSHDRAVGLDQAERLVSTS